MSFAASIATYLHNYAGLSALVGTRIYPVRAPDAPTFPYVVYSLRIEPENTLNSAPMDLATITATAFARDGASASGYGTAHSVAAQIRLALAYYRGTLASGGNISEGALVMSTEDQESADAGVFEVVTTAEMYYCP